MWLWLPVLTAVAPHAQGQTAVPVVTSDTREYCDALKQRFHGLVLRGHGPLPAEAAELSVAGERMCEHGHIRGGLLRLRRAIALLGQAQN